MMKASTSDERLTQTGSGESSRAELTDMLRGAGLKVTSTRIALLELVSRVGHHLTADEITNELRAQGHPVDRVTIYRNIERMMREGILMADLTPGRALRVTLFGRPGTAHHHHIVCDVCGTVAPTTGCFLSRHWETLEREVANATGFRLSGHIMQYYGVCSTCQENSRGK